MNTNTRITGFTETLQPITKKISNINTNVCLPIYLNGMNSNKINFFQSEFPNLTKIKPLIRLNQNSAKVELQKSNKKVKSKVSKINTKTKTKKKKIRFSLPSKTKSKTKKLY